VPLLLKVFLKAVQQALGSRLKDNLGTIVTAPFERVEETGAASRERMAGAQETMQQRVDKVHRRLHAVRANSAQDDQANSVTYVSPEMNILRSRPPGGIPAGPSGTDVRWRTGK
jgi:hypothetical protein